MDSGMTFRDLEEDISSSDSDLDVQDRSTDQPGPPPGVKRTRISFTALATAQSQASTKASGPATEPRSPDQLGTEERPQNHQAHLPSDMRAKRRGFSAMAAAMRRASPTPDMEPFGENSPAGVEKCEGGMVIPRKAQQKLPEGHSTTLDGADEDPAISAETLADIEAKIYYTKLIAVKDEIHNMSGDRRLPFPRAVDYLVDWDEDRLKTANGFLEDIQLMKRRMGYIKDMLELIVD